MLAWCFAWIVWLLCACGVRRFRGLRRICPCFSLFFFFCLVLISLLLVCFSLPLLLSLVLLSALFVLVALWVLLLFLFPFRIMHKKKGRKVLSLASSLVLLWVVVLDVLKHYRYLLRFIVVVSIPYAGNSCDLLRLFRCVVYYLAVFVYC